MANVPPENRRSRPAQRDNRSRLDDKMPRLKLDLDGEGEKPRRRPVRPRPSTAPKANIRLENSVRLPRLSSTRRRSVGRSIVENFKTGRIPSILGLLIVIGVGYWLLTSSTFYVSKIEVRGSRFLNAQEVMRVAGLSKTNVFLLNEEEVAKKLQALPYVMEVRVGKMIPDRLNVEVTERKSVLNWKVGSLNYLVDREGVVLDASLEKDLPATALTFPVIQSLDDRKLKLGDRVDPVAVRSAQTIQEQLGLAGVKLAAIQYSPSTGLLVLSDPTTGNWKALVGTDAQLEQKINILKGLLADKNIKWSYADLRFVNKPAIQ